MNGNGPMSNRPTGVMAAPGPSERGAARTIGGFMKVEQYAVQWYDDDGTSHNTIALYMSGTWYLAPNGENFAQSLRPMRGETWLAQKLNDLRASSTPTQTSAGDVPKEDAVNVLG